MSCITEILKLKGDNEVYVPEGNVVAVEGGSTYKEHEYLIILNSIGFRCGYVALHPEHPYSVTPEEEKNFSGRSYKHYDYDSLDIECHGGLTFMSANHALKQLLPIPCTDIWIGFDCGHLGDGYDITAFKKYYGEEKYIRARSFFDSMIEKSCQTVKTFHFVERECQSIIDQLIAVAA